MSRFKNSDKIACDENDHDKINKIVTSEYNSICYRDICADDSKEYNDSGNNDNNETKIDESIKIIFGENSKYVKNLVDNV